MDLDPDPDLDPHIKPTVIIGMRNRIGLTTIVAVGEAIEMEVMIGRIDVAIGIGREIGTMAGAREAEEAVDDISSGIHWKTQQSRVEEGS